MTDQLPIVVVGGGLAGLTATAVVAEAGGPVTLLERGGVAGGHARTTSRHGYRLNFGPHALGMAGPGTTVLRRLGLDLAGRMAPVRRARFLDGDTLVAPWRSRARGPLAATWRLLRALADASRHDPPGTIAEWLDGHVSHPAARRLALAMSRLVTYADAADVQAADVLAAQLRTGEPRYLHHGWQALVDGLRNLAVARGAVLETGAAAARVRLDQGRVAGVESTDGRWWPARSVILAVGSPADAAALVDGAAGDTIGGWASQATPVNLSALDLALSRRVDVAAPVVLGLDQPIYFSVHSDRADLTPGRGAVIHLARYQRPGGRAASRSDLEALADRLAPGWSDHVVHARFLPSITVTNDVVTAVSGGRAQRPGPAVPGTGGLFVAGDWVGPDGYLAQASLASAAVAAQRALDVHARDGQAVGA